MILSEILRISRLARNALLTFSIVFISIGILSAIILVVVSKIVEKPYEKYDVQNIVKYGQLLKGKITGITVRDNIIVNNESPRVIIYEFAANEKVKKDTFQTLEIKKLGDIQKQDSVDIIFYKNQSIINNLESYSLSLRLFWVFPFLFSLGGCISLIAYRYFYFNNPSS